MKLRPSDYWILPLWLMKKHTSSRKIGVLRSRKSLASSTITGISVSSSSSCRVCKQLYADKQSHRNAEWTHRNSRMIWSSTCYHEYSPTSLDFWKKILDSTKNDFLIFEEDSAAHCVKHRLRLLKNFFLHKIIKVSFHNLLQFQTKCGDFPRCRFIWVQCALHAMNGQPWKQPHFSTTEIMKLSKVSCRFYATNF